MEIRDKSSIRV